MNKRKWIYLAIGIFVIVVATVIAVVSICSYSFVKAKEADLQSYLEMPSENNYYAYEACIPDAQTAARIGSALIDNMCEKSAFDVGFVTVEYDAANRLWRVNKGYLFSQGGFVILQQDTGEVVRALRNK